MKKEKKNDVAALLQYAGSRRKLTFLGLILSAISMLLSMAPYICIWLTARNLIAVAPEWTRAQSVMSYGWMAFAFAMGGIVLYFSGLMCTHLAAFRTASNIRKQGVARVMKAPLGYFDSNASGLIRGRLDAAAADTETLLAHNLADIVGTIVLFAAMIVMMFVFDWRMGAACLLAAVISVISMFVMMGGKNAKIMAEYQAAQDRMTKAGTEYVRGIPVVKIFQQTVYSFKAFKQAIEDYSDKAEHYQADVCRVPQSVNLTFTEGAFVFQNDHLFKTSILENVRAARPNASREQVLSALTAAQCGDIIEKLPDGVDTQIGTEGTYLSGGEQQRIALARAILKDAPIVVLDEATASLDVENETKVQGALSRLLQGKTVLVIAHRMRTVEAADKIVVLSDGKVAEEGAPQELMEKGGLFHRMVELQRQSAKWQLG